MPTTQSVHETGIQEETDAELLRAFVEDESEAAFAEFVARHVNWVHSAAMRQVGSHAAAEDVTQAVFILLARKAGSLKRETVLVGWLFRTIRYVVRDALKMENRRRKREEEAASLQLMENTPDESSETWEEIKPFLDRALGRLSERDRNAVLLRFFGGHSWTEVGARVGLGENAARVRTVRALEELRKHLRRYGASVSTAGLSANLMKHSAQIAPARLAASAAGQSASAGALRLIEAVTRRWFWRRTFGVGLAFFMILAGLWLAKEWRQRSRDASVLQALRSIDRAYTFDNQFGESIHFRDATERVYLRNLTNFSRAAYEFRTSMRELFGSQLRPWRATFDLLLAGQPPIQTTNLARNEFVSQKGFAHDPVLLVRSNGVWRWAFFRGSTREAVERRMRKLDQSAIAFERTTIRARAGEFRTVEEALRALEKEAAR